MFLPIRDLLWLRPSALSARCSIFAIPARVCLRWVMHLMSQNLACCGLPQLDSRCVGQCRGMSRGCRQWQAAAPWVGSSCPSQLRYASEPPPTTDLSHKWNVPAAAQGQPRAAQHRLAGGQGGALTIQSWREKPWEEPHILHGSRTE